jgi:selenocysteine lyase/cysteine desulfurase
MYVSDEFLKSVDPVPPIVGYSSIATPSEDFQVPSGPISFHPTAKRYEHANMCLIGAVAAKAFLQLYLDVMNPEDVQTHLYRLGDLLRSGCDRLGVEILGPASHRHHAPHLYTLKLCNPEWSEFFKANNVVVSTFRWGVRISFGFYNNEADVKGLINIIKRGLERILED